jgi:hypothetical protein
MASVTRSSVCVALGPVRRRPESQCCKSDTVALTSLATSALIPVSPCAASLRGTALESYPPPMPRPAQGIADQGSPIKRMDVRFCELDLRFFCSPTNSLYGFFTRHTQFSRKAGRCPIRTDRTTRVSRRGQPQPECSNASPCSSYTTTRDTNISAIGRTEEKTRRSESRKYSQGGKQMKYSIPA